MSKAIFNIMVRSIKRRISNGESLDDILDGMTKLTDEEKEAIRKAIA